MSQSSYGPLFEALAHYNDKLLDMAKAQTERTAQALLQTNLDDLGQVLEQGSQQPWQLINAQMNWWQDQLKLMQHTLLKSAGQQSEPLIAPERSDRRFKADAWSEQPIYAPSCRVPPLCRCCSPPRSPSPSAATCRSRRWPSTSASSLWMGPSTSCGW